MKKVYLILAAALFAAACPQQAEGQSLKDLFNKKGIEGIVNTVVEQMDIIPENITGHWEYAGTAVKFTGDNMLMNAASELASGQVEEKLDEYLQIIGLKEGVFDILSMQTAPSPQPSTKWNSMGNIHFLLKKIPSN